MLLNNLYLVGFPQFLLIFQSMEQITCALKYQVVQAIQVSLYLH